MRRKTAFLRAVKLVLFLAPLKLPAQEIETADRFRARIHGTPIGEKLEVTLAGGERFDGPLAEVEAETFGLWVEADEEMRERLRVTSGKVKKKIRYEQVAVLRGAREVAISGEELALQLRIGESLRVRTADGRELRGKVKGFDGDSLQVGEHSLHLSQGEVERIEKVGDSLLDGALIGAGVGLGGTLLLCVAAGCDDGGVVGSLALLFGGGGAGLGVLFDALETRREAIYVSSGPSPRKRLSLAPLWTRDRKGLLVSLQF
jgi:small nuclear ribonucleoprotein (snRNP)-like protein